MVSAFSALLTTMALYWANIRSDGTFYAENNKGMREVIVTHQQGRNGVIPAGL